MVKIFLMYSNRYLILRSFLNLFLFYKNLWKIRNISYVCFMKSSKLDKNRSAEPTKSELEILQVLWESGPSTVRFVNDMLNEQRREVNYMSTQKLMLIMLDKGFVTKDNGRMTHIYKAAVDEGKTKSYMLDRVVHNLFNGSAGSLMMHLLGNKKVSPQEMEEFKQLIKKVDQKD
jgi:BlaI family transcriptional regulator, penicillinase repressor